MAEQVYDFGDIARLSVTFKVNGIATDPTTVTATVRSPDATQTDYAYNPGPITRDGGGLYHLDITVDQWGEWAYEFTGTGSAADVGPGIFYVRPDPTADDPHNYVSVDAIKETLSLVGQTNLDPLIADCIQTASRAVDLACDRSFYPIGSIASPASRYFTARHPWCDMTIGDTQSVTTLGIDMDGDGIYETTWTEGTHFYLGPADAPEKGKPFTELTLRYRSGRVFPLWQRAIKVTGVFGWPLPPYGVRRFTEILAKRLVSRSRDANQTLGLVLSGNDLGSVTRLARTDPDFDILLGEYVNIRQLVA